MSYGQPSGAPRPKMSGRMLFFLLAIGVFMFLKRGGGQVGPASQPDDSRSTPRQEQVVFPESPRHLPPQRSAERPGLDGKRTGDWKREGIDLNRQRPNLGQLPKRSAPSDDGWSLEEVEVDNSQRQDRFQIGEPTDSKKKKTVKGDWEIEEVN